MRTKSIAQINAQSKRIGNMYPNHRLQSKATRIGLMITSRIADALGVKRVYMDTPWGEVVSHFDRDSFYAEWDTPVSIADYSL